MHDNIQKILIVLIAIIGAAVVISFVSQEIAKFFATVLIRYFIIR
jgi:hypothetical protein